MKITNQLVAHKLAGYLHHEHSLAHLVDWAEDAMLDGDFEESQAAVLKQVVGRLGVADVRAFGLAWDDCEDLLQQLGFGSRIEVFLK